MCPEVGGGGVPFLMRCSSRAGVSSGAGGLFSFGWGVVVWLEAEGWVEGLGLGVVFVLPGVAPAASFCVFVARFACHGGGVFVHGWCGGVFVLSLRAGGCVCVGCVHT